MAVVIVVGGGLAGLSAAHTIIERGGKVILFDKNPFLGGNSTKATSGINGSGTRAQMVKGIKDSAEAFEKDTSISFWGGEDAMTTDKQTHPLVKVLTHQSGPAVEWLIDSFNLDLSLVSRLGGHSFPRTHRGKERFPGMAITMALMEKLDKIQKESQGKLAKIINKAKVTELIAGENGSVVGVVYEHEGQVKREFGPVIVATGGFAADFSKEGILAKVRPDLLHLPTTNGEHCTGDGIKFSEAIGADTADMSMVQVHPTGLVHPDEPDAKVKFLAAEALRGVGGLLLDKNGKRFCNELGRRDYVTGEMWKNQGPFHLVLNSAGGREIEWHCKHYQGRGLMKHFENGADLAKEIGISPDALSKTFNDYNEIAKTNKDPFGKKFFDNLPFEMKDNFWVAVVTPVLHYCMGGLKIGPDGEVYNTKNSVIPGLWAAGEVAGGVHGKNRLGGNSLLDCVVYGRVSGAAATRYILQNLPSTGPGSSGLNRANAIARHLTGNGTHIDIDLDPNSRQITLNISWNDQNSSPSVSSSSSSAIPVESSTPTPVSSSSSAPVTPAAVAGGKKEYTLADVAKHNTEKDCWVVVNGQVLDVTGFLKDHPGGKKAIMLYAGKDASEEFNMLHKPDVVERYAPETVIGTLKK